MARGLFGSLARGFVPDVTRASSGFPSYGSIPPLGSVASAAGVQISQATALTVSSVYACISIRSRDVARCAPSVYSEDDNGARKKVKKHPVAELFKRPNRIQTWFEFCRDLMVAYLLRGNAYCAILRDGRGNPKELIPINPDAVLVLEASDGSIFYNVNRIGLWQIAMLRDFPVAIPAEDVFHLRGISFNTLVGASTIGLARDSIGVSMALSQQAARWLANGSKPSVILESPKQLTKEAADRLKQSWKDWNAGLQNVGGTAVLEDGLKATPLQLTAVQLEFIDQANFSVQDIARIFSVPTRKLMQPDTTRGSTIIQEEQDYVNTTVAPDLEMLEQKFIRTFEMDEEGLGVDLDETSLLRADPLTRYNLGRIGKLSGLISTNEWRRGERLPPDPNGDELMQPVNLAALGSDMSGEAPDGAGRPQSGTVPDEGVPTKPAPKPAPADDAAPEG